jgi:inorganic triphosphatase YgiF
VTPAAARPPDGDPGRGGLEVELKLAASDGQPLRLLRRRRRLGPATLGRALSYDELDRYLDTADRALATARWACRLRERQGRAIVSLKGPRRDAGGSALAVGSSLHARPEVEGPAGDAGRSGSPITTDQLPPSAARDFLANLVGDRALLERFALGQRRTERDVRVADRLVGILSLDRVDVLADGRPVGRLWAVELELAGDPGADADPAPALVAALGDALAAVPGLSPDHRTKLEHALELIGTPLPARPRR